jgi:hypothetical protein
LHRAGSGGVAREGGEGEQDGNGPGMAHRNLLKGVDGEVWNTAKDVQATLLI